VQYYLCHVPRIVYNVYLVEVDKDEDPREVVMNARDQYIGTVDAGELGWDESVRGDEPDFFGPYADRQTALDSIDHILQEGESK
jgi:hypothetical protein